MIKTAVVKLLTMIQKVDEREKLTLVSQKKLSSLKYTILFPNNHQHRNSNRDPRLLHHNNPLSHQLEIQNRILCPNLNPKKKNKKIVQPKVQLNNKKKYHRSIKKKQRQLIIKPSKKNWKIKSKVFLLIITPPMLIN